MSKSLSDTTINQHYIINYVLPSIVDYTLKSKKIVDQCNSIEDYKELEISFNFLVKFLDYVIYVLQAYDKKDIKNRIVKLSNIDNLLYINAYLNLFVKKNERRINMYWNKNKNNKSYIIYCIILNLAEYLYTSLD